MKQLPALWIQSVVLGFLLVAFIGYLVPSLMLANTWLAALGLVAASLVVVFAIFVISVGMYGIYKGDVPEVDDDEDDAEDAPQITHNRL
jgi:hypothetical protein